MFGMVEICGAAEDYESPTKGESARSQDLGTDK